MKQTLTIVKVGGAVVEDEVQLAQLLKDFCAIPGRKVLIHGGGRRATQVAASLGIESKMVGGRRITDAEMLSVVTMVYGGLVNKHVVAGLQALGADAIGLCGADADIIRSAKRPLKNGIDYGFVGDVKKADGAKIDDKLSPVAAVMAGLGIELGEYFTIDAGYRYMYMFSPKFDVVDGLNPTAHQFRVGARINF